MAAGITRGARASLWRYNYAVLLGGSYWILVLPVAASQIVTLWLFALSSDFSQTTAIQIAEMMTPILGAFLVAHTLAPEYRSGIGAVLACKPVSLHRVVTMRVVIALLVPLLLSGVTLAVCSVGLKQIEIGTTLLAALPSLWFLSMLALTCATLFRSSLAGFAVAGAVWGLDVAFGYGFNPLLSSRGFEAHSIQDPLSSLWLIGKITLLILGTALLFLHARLLHRICRPSEPRDLTKIAASVLAAVALYCGSGSAVLIGYHYQIRAVTPGRNVETLRRDLGVYGPVPVSRLFGPAFVAYVSQPVTKSGLSQRPLYIQQLEQALQRWPKSIWADSIAFAIAWEKDADAPGSGADAYLLVADRYAASPLAPRALAAIIKSEAGKVPADFRLHAARRLLADYPGSEDAEHGAQYLFDQKPGTILPAELLQAAKIAARAAPRTRQPTWLVIVARATEKVGAKQDALQAANEALRRGTELRTLANSGTPDVSDLVVRRGQIDGAIADATKLIQSLSHNP